MIDKYHGLRKKIIDIEADFMFEMKNVLTPKQIALFVTFKEKNDEQYGIRIGA